MVHREKDGFVKSRLVLKDFNRDPGPTQPEMFAPTPSTLSLKTMLVASSHDRNNHLEREYIAIAIHVHTRSCTLVLTKNCLQRRSVVWTSQGTETVAPTRCKSSGKPESPSTLDRSEWFQKYQVGQQHVQSC